MDIIAANQEGCKSEGRAEGIPVFKAFKILKYNFTCNMESDAVL